MVLNAFFTSMCSTTCVGFELELQPQRVDNFFVAALRQAELQRAKVGVHLLLHEQHRRAAANAAERVADGDGSRRWRVAHRDFLGQRQGVA